MSCPRCGCKVTYPYGRDDGSDYEIDDPERDRCAACGHVFYIDDHLPEDDDEEEPGQQVPDLPETKTAR